MRRSLPLARIRNTRTAYALRDADGALVAEFVDDQVRATRRARPASSAPGASGSSSSGRPRPPTTAAFFAAVEAAVHAAGGRAAASASKLARALGA